MTDKIIKIALFISIITYQFWDLFPKGSFYIGNAIFILLLSTVVYLSQKSLWTFLLICLSLNNLLDELFFNPTKQGLNEVFVLIVVPVIWYVIKRYYDRKINKQ